MARPVPAANLGCRALRLKIKDAELKILSYGGHHNSNRILPINMSMMSTIMMKNTKVIKTNFWIRVATAIFVICIFAGLWTPAAAFREIVRFSTATAGGDFPAGWEPLTFKNIPRHTQYTLVRDRNTVVVKAVSKSSASGLIYRIKIDPRVYPIVSWRWKVTNTFLKGDVTKKKGDDYPARVYIAFEYDPKKLSFFERTQFKAARLLYGEYPPTGAITYIWSSNAPRGTIVSNPYTKRSKMIAVRSGKTLLNTWMQEERNVYEDYKTAFSQEPPMIGAVMIMTDSDNTGESAISYFGDIKFKQK